MREHLKSACEDIDAAIFSGDSLEDVETRKEFKEFSSLAVHRAMIPNGCSRSGSRVGDIVFREKIMGKYYQ